MGRRADPPLAHALPARRGVRGGGGGRGAPGRGAYATPLEDELGDLLYQVVFHALLAQEAGEFTMADVARGIHDKLVRRHPHVFGDVVADQTSDVMRNWEQIKKEEKGTTSIVEGITPGPAVAPLHPQAVPQGGVGRARSRRPRRGARSHRRSPSPGCAPGATTSRPTSRRCWRARSSSHAPVASTPNPRCAAGPRPTAAASRPWSELAIARDLDLAALDPAGVDSWPDHPSIRQ